MMAPIMTHIEMFRAIQALDDDLCLRLDVNGKWYVSCHRIEIGGDGCLTSISGDHCETPEKAIRSTWQQIAKLRPDRFLVVDSSRKTRKHYRWNGFMWEELFQPKEAIR